MIAKFIADKFEDLNKTYEESSPEEKRTLMCSIFPSGLAYNYPGYSNTAISPFYMAMLDLQKDDVQFSARHWTESEAC